MPEELFWRLTLRELGELFKRSAEQEKRELRRFALVAATILNVNRKLGSTLVQPDDLIRTERREEDYLTVKQSKFALDRWAASVNADFAKVAAHEQPTGAGAEVSDVDPSKG